VEIKRLWVIIGEFQAILRSINRAEQGKRHRLDDEPFTARPDQLSARLLGPAVNQLLTIGGLGCRSC
jgi:hypothetical protein